MRRAKRALKLWAAGFVAGNATSDTVVVAAELRAEADAEPTPNTKSATMRVAFSYPARSTKTESAPSSAMAS
jgi:hypothetical protein